MEGKNNKTGYYYELTDEQIARHLSLSPAQILEWLEETNRFLYTLRSTEQRAWARAYPHAQHSLPEPTTN